MSKAVLRLGVTHRELVYKSPFSFLPRPRNHLEVMRTESSEPKATGSEGKSLGTFAPVSQVDHHPDYPT